MHRLSAQAQLYTHQLPPRPGSLAPAPVQLTFQLPFPVLTGYAAFKCVATASNSKGWGTSSSARPTMLPPRCAPPASPGSLL